MQSRVMAVVVIVKGLTFAHDDHAVDADVDERSVNEIVVHDAIIPVVDVLESSPSPSS